MKSNLNSNLSKGILVLFLVVVLSGCSFSYGRSTKNSTSSISVNTSNELTKTSKTTDTFDKDEIVTFTYKSQVKNGTLSLKLIDSKENLISTFEVNKNEKKDIKITKSDTYEIVAICDKFKGSYEVKWGKTE